MELIFVVLVVVAILNVCLALLVFLKNPKNKINVFLGLSILSFGLWTLGEAMFDRVKNLGEVLMWGRLENTFATLVVIFFFFFTLYFPFQHKKLNLFEKGLVIFSSVVLLLLLWSKWHIDKVYINPVGMNDFHLNVVGRSYYALYFLVYLLVSFYWLVRKYLVSSGVAMKNVAVILWATGFVAVFGTFFGVYIPLLFGRDNPWYASLFSIPMVLVLSYFILFGHKEVIIR